MSYLVSPLKTLFGDIMDIIKYDMFQRPLPEVDHSFLQQDTPLIVHKDKDGVWVEFPTYPGLMTSGDNWQQLMDNIHDALLTYHGVPRGIAKRLRRPADKLTFGGETYVRPEETNFIEEIIDRKVTYKGA